MTQTVETADRADTAQVLSDLRRDGYHLILRARYKRARGRVMLWRVRHDGDVVNVRLRLR